MSLPPTSMKTFDITNTGVKIGVAAIEWPANATVLVYEEGASGCDDGALVYRTTDPDESKEGAETSEIRIICNADQVIGTSSVVTRMNVHIRMRMSRVRRFIS